MTRTVDYSFYLIADTTLCLPQKLLTIAADIIDQGITCVQLRMKNQVSEEILTTAKQLSALLRPRNIPLIINDHSEIAKACDADGVHIGQTDKPYAWVRQQLSYKKIIGVSIETVQQAQRCQSLDCDYFGVGPIFNTTTKQDAATPLGIERLKRIKSIVKKPIVAIGGINEANSEQVLATQVAGIALASAIFSSPNPKQSTQRLSQIISHSFSCTYAK
jgi:thiamine-phosphate pyrophosphorylase